jgi:hypothetical protein
MTARIEGLMRAAGLTNEQVRPATQWSEVPFSCG